MEQITDHSDRALARLRSQYQGKPKIAALVAALVDEVQEFDDALWDLYLGRMLDDATGAQLASIGFVVGEPNAGRPDDDYRRFIRARIKTNRSNGLPEELLAIARLVIDDETAELWLEPQHPASVVLHVDGIIVIDELAEIVLSFLRDAVAGGVRILLEYVPSDDADSLRFDGVVAGEGLGDSTDPLVGGQLITAKE